MTEQKTLATHGGCCPTCGYEMSAYQWSNHQSCPKCATPSLPDTQERYPSEEQIAGWIADYFASVEHRGMRYEAFLAMKACQWQAEQDALICEQVADGGALRGHEIAARQCAFSIRACPTPPQPGAAQ